MRVGGEAACAAKADAIQIARVIDFPIDRWRPQSTRTIVTAGVSVAREKRRGRGVLTHASSRTRPDRSSAATLDGLVIRGGAGLGFVLGFVLTLALS